jgi:hypothetical protein
MVLQQIVLVGLDQGPFHAFTGQEEQLPIVQFQEFGR